MVVEIMPSIIIYEVGPRDGIQSIPHHITNWERVRLIRRLHEAGIRRIEVGSMVSPRRVPNMARSAQVFAATRELNPRFSLLVVNRRGVVEGQRAGCERFNIFISPNDEFNRANYGRTYEDILERCSDAVMGIPPQSIRVYISMAFSCSQDALKRAIKDGKALGRTIVLCDTAGTATPEEVRETIHYAQHFTDNLALHLHYSEFLFDNLEAGYKAGIRQFDTSIGGIGGCPFVQGSSANLPTEDLVKWCEERGISCGTTTKDLRPAVRAARRLKKPLRRREVHRKLHKVWATALAHPMIGGSRR